MYAWDPTAGSMSRNEYFDTSGTNPGYRRTQMPWDQPTYGQGYTDSRRGSSDFSAASSRSSLLIEDTTRVAPTSSFISPLFPSPVTRAQDALMHPQSNLDLVSLFDSFQGLQHPSNTNLELPPLDIFAEDSYAFQTQPQGVPTFGQTAQYPTWTDHQTSLHGLGFESNIDSTLSRTFGSNMVLSTHVDVQAFPISHGGDSTQPLNAFETSPSLNPWLGGSQNEMMGNTATNHLSPIASPPSSVDVDDQSVGRQPVNLRPQQQNNARSTENLPLEEIDKYLRRNPLPRSKAGHGSRGGAKDWSCTYHPCTHGPYTNKRRDQTRCHIAAHLGYKSHKCESCQSKFLRRADLKRHITNACKSLKGNTRSGAQSIAPRPGSSPAGVGMSTGESLFFNLPDARATKGSAKYIQVMLPIQPWSNFVRSYTTPLKTHSMVWSPDTTDRL